MDAHEELVLRIATRQRKQLGLSSAGYGELLIAVRNDPRHFVDSPEDEAMALMAKALKQYNDSRGGDDLLDDAEYMQARTRRMARMRRDCAEALAIDRNCIDAHLCDIIASDAEPDALLDLLLPLEVDAEKLLEPHLHEASRPAGSGVEAGQVDEIISVSDDLWNDVFARPLLRVRATMARAYFDAARYRLACAEALGTIDLSPLDLLGARHTAALAYARLEDEQGFESLDARFGRRGNAWQSLARIILLFKLGRPGAAKRALHGFDQLCEGGVYALLRPILIDTYMPDRPAIAPYSFEEATLAVHEADPIIVDVPDLLAWVESQEDMAASALRFARRSGFDW